MGICSSETEDNNVGNLEVKKKKPGAIKFKTTADAKKDKPLDIGPKPKKPAGLSDWVKHIDPKTDKTCEPQNFLLHFLFSISYRLH